MKRLPGPLTILLLLGPGVGFLLIFFAFPLVFSIAASLTPDRTASAAGPTLANYAEIFATRSYSDGLLFSLYLSVVPTIVALAISVPLAVALESRFPGHQVFRTLYQIPLAVPTIVAAFLILLLLDRGGMLSRVLSSFGLPMPRLVRDKWAIGAIAAMVWKAVPFMTLIVAGAIASIPRDLLDAAGTLGAPRYRVFLDVQLPLALPGITAAALLVFVGSTGSYTVPNLLGPVYPEALSIHMYKNAFIENRWGLVAAMGTILSAIACAVLVAYYRLTRNLGGGYGGEVR